MFQCFSALCMQTLRDKEKMELLGISPEKLPILGNLKFATRARGNAPSSGLPENLVPQDRILFVAGSTHPDEEQLLFDCYAQLRKTNPKLFLVVAPRDPNRAQEIVTLAARRGLLPRLRSGGVFSPADLLILDTIGELVDFYALADLAFVGGSLVSKGGHNPVEPATMAIPVLFGPHMEDFSEIAESLIQAGGAREVSDQQQLSMVLAELLQSSDLRAKMGQAAQKCVYRQQDIIANHLQLIEKFL
jgi:3-deoxy-D-manno-octulosonic-acid transferase